MIRNLKAIHLKILQKAKYQKPLKLGGLPRKK